ncbi:NOL1/NOP2/sun domain protein [Apiospora aurea]|uniref:NOL1/NOP2/sun domain protein n=1 Tax=Apiospora aurea TaxID=335848 RepID=A0ABR1QXE4_9PEZI
MSLYHEAAEILSLSPEAGGNLKTRIFNRKDLKSPQQQIYALALETCKWSAVLKEVIDNAGILKLERKLTPVLASLLVHDHLLAKKGVALPSTHGLRAAVERHKARLSSELTRARLRRKAVSIDALRDQVEAAFAETENLYPRWVRVNTLLTSLEDQLDATFKDFTRVHSIKDVVSGRGKCLYIDEHVPNLLAVSPSFEITKTDTYKSGKVILQDKASCFPAYLLDAMPEDGDAIDTCSAPGNKTTHLTAIIHSRIWDAQAKQPKVFAFEKNPRRAKTLEKMVKLAGGDEMTRIGFGQDFLKVNHAGSAYKNVGCLLLDPSCSGSGIVGRDSLPTLHLPEPAGAKPQPPKTGKEQNRKRKRTDDSSKDAEKPVLVDDDGEETVLSSEKELSARLEALASFQLILLQHAMEFPAAKKITYSTCSIHAQENEQVVLKALQSEVARRRGWRILKRQQQVRGMREWPVRGTLEGAEGDEDVAEGCIRSYKDDGRGVMGFFVAAFARDPDQAEADGDGPYLRDDDGRIVRDGVGIPTLKSGQRALDQHSHEKPQVTTNRVAEDDNEEAADESYSEVDSDDVDDDEWDGFGD